MKRSTLIKTLVISSLLSASTFTYAQMDHSAMGMNHSNMAAPKPVLPIEAGNDAFGTIQEMITLLNNDPSTDWSKVNLEALRLHLLDMEDMTFNVDVLSQTPIENGMVAVVKATTKRAEKALKRIFSAHPKVLKTETGFEMNVAFNDGTYTLTTTSTNPKDADKIRGLGYIGLMAYGNHHQPHHYSMAKGANPHSGHH